LAIQLKLAADSTAGSEPLSDGAEALRRGFETHLDLSWKLTPGTRRARRTLKGKIGEDMLYSNVEHGSTEKSNAAVMLNGFPVNFG
jgi:hypothetical protein